MKKNKFLDFLNYMVPLESQDSWDNSGLQLDNYNDNCKKILLALDINDKIIDEAINYNVDFIITHHPLIFDAIKTITSNEIPGSYILKLIKAGIGVYSTHTPFDKVKNGNNDYFGKLLGFDEVYRAGDSGYLSYGVMDKKVAAKDFLLSLKKGIFSDYFENIEMRCIGNLDEEIKTIGWCTGSGSDFLNEAIASDLDMFITGDLKYHFAQEASEKDIVVVDMGHYGTEKLFAKAFEEKVRTTLEEISFLGEKIMDFPEIVISNIDINPFTVL